MPKQRRRFTPQQKAAIVREHFVDKIPVSDLCDRHGIQPTLFYRWQKEMLENLSGLFERQSASQLTVLKRQNEALRAKIAHKDEVIAEIMESHVALKKTLGPA